VPVPLPTDAETDREPPAPAEVALVSRAVATAIAPADGLTRTQRFLLEALFPAMTGHAAVLDGPEVDAGALAVGLAWRDRAFRTRILQLWRTGSRRRPASWRWTTGCWP
jgi:hypothetical protein